jgi:hypothetical protein
LEKEKAKSAAADNKEKEKAKSAAADNKEKEKEKKSTAGKSSKKQKQKFLLYKGKPLVRSGNILYYGDMSEPHVVMLQILTTKELGGIEVADKVQVQLMSTDPDLKMKDRISKKVERRGLYNAMDIGSIWLQRALNEI